MSIRVCLCFLAFAAGLGAQPMFEGASGLGDEIKSNPKTVRVERETLGNKATRVIEEEQVYGGDRKLISSSRYVEGKKVSTETFEYDGKGQRTKIETRDGEGKITRTQTFRRLEDGTEEENDSVAGKSIRRFDSAGRVVELTTLGDDRTAMTFSYDDHGRPLEARVKLPGEGFKIERGANGEKRGVHTSDLSMRLAISYPGGKIALMRVYGPGEELMMSLETQEDNAGNQASYVLFEQDAQNPPFTSSRVESQDEQGNWTVRTLFERDARTQVDRPVARLHRTITYH